MTSTTLPPVALVTELPGACDPDAFTLHVASDWELRRIDHQVRIARYLAALQTHLSRRAVPCYLADRIIDCHLRLVKPDGSAFTDHDGLIDALYGEDGSCRWYGDFRRFADRPPRQAAQSRVLMRLRGIDIAARVDARDRDASQRDAGNAGTFARVAA